MLYFPPHTRSLPPPRIWRMESPANADAIYWHTEQAEYVCGLPLQSLNLRTLSDLHLCYYQILV